MHFTSDGHTAYLDAVEGALGCVVDFAQLVKIYGAAPGPAGPLQPRRVHRGEEGQGEGRPDMAHVSSSYVERQNLTMRMHMRRFTRLTNALLKTVENYAYAVALHYM